MDEILNSMPVLTFRPKLASPFGDVKCKWELIWGCQMQEKSIWGPQMGLRAGLEANWGLDRFGNKSFGNKKWLTTVLCGLWCGQNGCQIKTLRGICNWIVFFV